VYALPLGTRSSVDDDGIKVTVVVDVCAGSSSRPDEVGGEGEAEPVPDSGPRCDHGRIVERRVPEGSRSVARGESSHGVGRASRHPDGRPVGLEDSDMCAAAGRIGRERPWIPIRLAQRMAIRNEDLFAAVIGCVYD